MARIPDAFDYDDAYNYPDDNQANDPQCRKCGMWCRWHEHPQGWRLTMPDGSVHLCGVVADVDEFGIVE